MKVRCLRLAAVVAALLLTGVPVVGCDSSSDSTPSGGTDVSGGGDTGGTDGSGVVDTGSGTTDTGGGTVDTGSGTSDTGSGTNDTGGPVDTGGGTADTGADAGVTPTVSGAVCGEMMLCTMACADGDNACVEACVANARAVAEVAELSALNNCFEANCAGEADGKACMLDKCAAEYDACTVADGSCGQVFHCSLLCVLGNCADSCIFKGTAEAQAQFVAVEDCLNDNCTKPVSTDCRVDKSVTGGACRNEAVACSPPGTETCTYVVDDCILSCAGDEGCIEDCLAKGTLSAQINGARYWSCMKETCGPTPTPQCKQTAKDLDCGILAQECYQK